jgi:FdhE protein
MTAPHSVDALGRQRPEWQPWLAVVEEVLRETASGAWDEVVPDPPDARGRGVPLLAGSAIALQSSDVRRVLLRLVRVASRAGNPKMTFLDAALRGTRDVLPLFTAALRHDGERIDAVAAAAGADPEALQAIVALLPIPFLQACNRRLGSSVPGSWMEGHCPVCGSWPAFAEVRGIERSRYLRCRRCGGEWYAHSLRCSYCAMDDHDELVALVPEDDPAHAVVEACRRCLGYLKTFTRLQGCAPDAVMLEDLASVNLDVVSLTHGYTRPPGAGHRLDVTVTEKNASRRFFAWNA